MAGDMNYVRDGMMVLESMMKWSRDNPNAGDGSVIKCREYLIANGWDETLVDDVMTITEEALIKLYELSKIR